MSELLELEKLSKVQRNFFNEVAAELRSNGIDDFAYKIEGNEEHFLKLDFRNISIYLYADGSSQILSKDRLVKRWLIFPSIIDWRIEQSQYQDLEILRFELLKALNEAISIVRKK